MDAFWRGGGRPLIKRQTSVVDTEAEQNNNSASRASSNNSASSTNENVRSNDTVNLGSEHSDESCNGDNLSSKSADSGESSTGISSGSLSSANSLGIGLRREINSSTSSVSDDAGTTPSIPIARIRPEEAEKHFQALDTILCPLISSYSANDPQMSKCSIRRKFYTQTYMHYPHSISLGKSYGDLARALRTREVIQLTRDYVMRIGQVQSFIYTLQRLAIEEHCLLLQKRKAGQRVSAEDSKVDCLVAICDDMRGHISHWSSLTNKLLLSDWMKCYRWRILQKLQEVRKQLHFLMQTALWWLNHLFNSCIHVFAITTYHQIPENILWNITRGVEEFGIILDLAKSRGLLKQLHAMGWCNLPIFSPQTSDCSLPILSITNKPNLARLLNEISKSRSALVAELIYEIFSSNDTIVELLNLDKQSDYKWSMLQSQNEGESNDNLKDGITIHLMQKHISSLLLYVKMEENFATQILTSLSTNTNMLRKTNLRSGVSSPGGGGYVSPRSSSAQDAIAQLSRLKNRRISEASYYFQESSFSIDCYKPKIKTGSDINNQSSDHQSSDQGQNNNKHVATTPVLTLTEANQSDQSESIKVSFSGSNVSARKPRKSVKWNDSATSSAVNHFKTRYLNILWLHLKEALSRIFREPGWTTVESARFCLGDVRLLSTTAIMFVSKSLHHLSNDDGFSSGAVGGGVGSGTGSSGNGIGGSTTGGGGALKSVIQHISKSIYCSAVNIFTDQEFRRVLVSAVSDKSGVMSVGEDVSATTKLVIGAIKPSISLAESISREQPDAADLSGVSESSGGSSGTTRISLLLFNSNSSQLSAAALNCSSVLPPNLVECSTLIGCYSAWFSSQISQSTLNWNVQSYVNMAHIDLIMIKELVSRHLLAVETLMSNHGSTSPLDNRLNISLPNSLSLIPLHITALQLKNSLQTLHKLAADSEKMWREQCETVCKNHWITSFPLNKVWKTRSSAGLLSGSMGGVGGGKPQEYAQKAIVSIVEPVGRAACVLRVNSQVKIMSTLLRTLFQTWMDHILYNRVRFTVVGAYQLSVDFECIEKWVGSNYCQLDQEAVSQLKQLQIFREASSIISILQDESPPLPLPPPPSHSVAPTAHHLSPNTQHQLASQQQSSLHGVKTKSAHSLLDIIDPHSEHCSSSSGSEKERSNSGTASAPILREWDTNSVPSLDKRRKLFSGSEPAAGSADQNQAMPFGNFFVSSANDAENNISQSVLDARKSSTSGNSDSSAFSSSVRIATESSTSGFVHVERANEWQSLRAGKSFCPMHFGIVPFLCTDTDN